MSKLYDKFAKYVLKSGRQYTGKLDGTDGDGFLIIVDKKGRVFNSYIESYKYI